MASVLSITVNFDTRQHISAPECAWLCAPLERHNEDATMPRAARTGAMESTAMSLTSLISEFLDTSENCVRQSLLSQGEAIGWAGAAERLRAELQPSSLPKQMITDQSESEITSRSERIPTLRPVLTILRSASAPLSVTEIMRIAKSQGHDLLRRSVVHALTGQIARGVVQEVNGGRYRIAHNLKSLAAAEEW